MSLLKKTVAELLVDVKYPTDNQLFYGFPFKHILAFSNPRPGHIEDRLIHMICEIDIWKDIIFLYTRFPPCDVGLDSVRSYVSLSKEFHVHHRLFFDAILMNNARLVCRVDSRLDTTKIIPLKYIYRCRDFDGLLLSNIRL